MKWAHVLRFNKIHTLEQNLCLSLLHVRKRLSSVSCFLHPKKYEFDSVISVHHLTKLAAWRTDKTRYDCCKSSFHINVGQFLESKAELYLCTSWRHTEGVGTRWKWVVSFTPRPLYPREMKPLIQLVPDPGTHWIRGRAFWRRTHLQHVLEIASQFLRCHAVSLTSKPTELKTAPEERFRSCSRREYTNSRKVLSAVLHIPPRSSFISN